MSIVWLQSERNTNLYVRKANSANSLLFTGNECLFMWGAYKCDVVVVIKMGAYIHGLPVLIYSVCVIQLSSCDVTFCIVL